MNQTSSLGISYDVLIWKVEKRERQHGTSYRVVWRVGSRRWTATYQTSALAESYRSELLSASRKGEAFDVATGRPVSHVRAAAGGLTWYAFACKYVDLKWPRVSANHRRGIADSLVTVTCALLTRAPAGGEAKELRAALKSWAFNSPRRRAGNFPDGVDHWLQWIVDQTPEVSTLAQPDTLRRVLDSLAVRLDGQPAAGRTVHRKRAVFSNALAYAAELGLVEPVLLGTLNWKAPKAGHGIERQSVPNPTQARQLLDVVKVTPRSGDRLHAFFACLYYAGLRPEEATDLRRSNLELPDSGWGWIIISKVSTEVGKAWTDDGEQRESRQLKHRAVGQIRRIPLDFRHFLRVGSPGIGGV